MASQQRQTGSSIRRIETQSGPRWRFRIDVEPGPNGERRQRTLTFTTEAEAVAEQAAKRTDLARGTYIPPNVMTVNQWLDQWLRTGRRTWRPSTYDSYVVAVKVVRAAIGDRRMQQIRRADIEDIVDDMSRTGGHSHRGRSPRTIGLLIGLLRKAFDEAIIDGIIQTNPARHVKKPTQTHQEMQTWTADQLRTFLDAARNDDLAGAWALTAMGLRRGEVLGIRWSDIDFPARQMHVRQARVQTGNVVVTGAPKTARGRRTLPLNDTTIAMLKHTRSHTIASLTDRLVVVDEAGQPLKPEVYSDRFARLAKRAGLPPIRLHDVRHSALSIMLEQGTSVPVVAKIAGHDPSVTMRTYAHAQEEATRRAVDALGALFTGS